MKVCASTRPPVCTHTRMRSRMAAAMMFLESDSEGSDRSCWTAATQLGAAATSRDEMRQTCAPMRRTHGCSTCATTARQTCSHGGALASTMRCVASVQQDWHEAGGFLLLWLILDGVDIPLNDHCRRCLALMLCCGWCGLSSSILFTSSAVSWKAVTHWS